MRVFLGHAWINAPRVGRSPSSGEKLGNKKKKARKSLSTAADPARPLPLQAPALAPRIGNKPGYGVSIEPALGEVYYRNDRKSVQCFPLCPTYGTYEQAVKAMSASRAAGPPDEARSGVNAKHNESGSCRSTVTVALTAPAGVLAMPFLRFVRTADAFAPTVSQREAAFQVGRAYTAAALADLGLYAGEWHPVRREWVFAPRTWKLVGELHRASRRAAERKAFALQIVVAERDGDAAAVFTIAAKLESSTFDVLNCKTLMRDVKKTAGGDLADRSASPAPPPPPQQQPRAFAPPPAPPLRLFLPPTPAPSTAPPSSTATTATMAAAAARRSGGAAMTPLTSLAHFFSPSLLPPTPSSSLLLSTTPPAVSLPPDAFDEPSKDNS